ncbi:hypothetical protein AB986_09395 [Alkalihalobacillus macyae]|uniref:Uncharacterized protein n=1 Tax=Guptibacillus hwajinpoensis TaxID=208199 RepID=A0A0J6CSW3_9BACL|nr:hypothetical protein AB986_09395 [Alkalihalobacillus macyae]
MWWFILKSFQKQRSFRKVPFVYIVAVRVGEFPLRSLSVWWFILKSFQKQRSFRKVPFVYIVAVRVGEFPLQDARFPGGGTLEPPRR